MGTIRRLFFVLKVSANWAALTLVAFIWVVFSATLTLAVAEDQKITAANGKLTGADGEEYTIQDLEAKVRSTLLFGGSSPVSFMGEGRLKITDNHFREYPEFMAEDRAWTSANWEGNESFLRLGMVVRPSRNTVLWSKIGFQSTLPGIHVNEDMIPDSLRGTGFRPVQTRHDKNRITANIHEDMSAGIALRTKPAAFWLKMGNILWVEASPLTIWKSQPRTFAWDYLPYEIEQPIARYYEYNVVKGEKTGRAAWNKKPFNGIQLESINLPWDLYVNGVYGTYERYDNFEKEYVDWSNDLGLADQGGDAKSTGIGDSYRHMYHARISKNKALGKLRIGANYAGIRYREDVIYNEKFLEALRWTRNERKVFYKNNDIFSVDARGDINPNLNLHVDLAVNSLDTVYTRLDSVVSGTDTLAPGEWHRRTPIQPALYANLQSRYFIPVQMEFAYISKGFYSPFSFAPPVDAFYPYGSNLVGSGKFIGRGEASPYVQNMTGLQLTVSPPVGYGHLKFFYGLHRQIEASRDLLYFPYRLNGQDLFGVFHSSYSRWGNGLVDGPLEGDYNKRLGDENSGTGAGGLHSDFLSLYEGFVPYPSVDLADSNANEPFNLYRGSRFTPRHRKWSFNLGVDASYDIGPFIGYAKDFFLGGYAAVNGVGATLTPIAFDQTDLLLWSLYLRFEPAVALTDKLYVVGLAGYENWKSDLAYVDIDPGNDARAAPAPIDYKDWAYGLGFDWDIAPRVGLHGRWKMYGHMDEYSGVSIDNSIAPADTINYTVDNNWKSQLISGELKMWF